MVASVTIGQYEYSLDAKNRLVVPPRYREALYAEQGNHFILALGLDNCIWLILPTQWRNLQQDIQELPGIDHHDAIACAGSVEYSSLADPPEARCTAAQEETPVQRVRRPQLRGGVPTAEQLHDDGKNPAISKYCTHSAARITGQVRVDRATRAPRPVPAQT